MEKQKSRKGALKKEMDQKTNLQGYLGHYACVGLSDQHIMFVDYLQDNL